MSKKNGKTLKFLAAADRDVILKDANSNVKDYVSLLEEQIERLSEIGLALSKEKDMPTLLEMILEEAKLITNCDGRTLYMLKMDEDIERLKFEIVRTDSSISTWAVPAVRRSLSIL